MRFWDALTGAEVAAPFVPSNVNVNGVAFSPNGRVLAVASSDRTLRLFSLADRRVISLTGHSAAVSSVRFSADGRFLISGSWDRTVRIWNLATGQSRVMSGHASAVTSVDINGNGTRAVSGGLDNQVRLWDLVRGTVITISGHRGDVNGVASSPNGALAASVGADGAVYLWGAADGRPRWPSPRRHTAAVTAVAFSGDGRYLYSSGGSTDATVRVWRVADGAQVVLWNKETFSGIPAIAVAGTGATFAFARADSTVGVVTLPVTLAAAVSSLRQTAVAEASEPLPPPIEEIIPAFPAGF